MVFAFWPIHASPKVLCWKAHHRDAKSTCPAKDLVFRIKSAAIIVPKLEGKVLC
jgi:hypothetical protein